MDLPRFIIDVDEQKNMLEQVSGRLNNAGLTFKTSIRNINESELNESANHNSKKFDFSTGDILNTTDRQSSKPLLPARETTTTARYRLSESSGSDGHSSRSSEQHYDYKSSGYNSVIDQ